MIAPARRAALRALQRVAARELDLGAALAATRAELRDARDRALAAEVVQGVLRWQAQLDAGLTAVSGRPLHRLDTDILLILRLALYQLRFLDRVPARAVVDDAVALARMTGHTSAAGFVNAVLRAALRQPERTAPPGPPAGTAVDEWVRYLSVTGSHPEWLVRRWIARYGLEAARDWVAFDNAPAPVYLRANPLVSARADVLAWLATHGCEGTPAARAPDGVLVRVGHPARLNPQGAFLQQDEGSQLVGLTVGAGPGDRVLDVCAAPGGKALQLAAALDGRGLLVACDVRPARLDLLRETLRTGQADVGHLVRIAPAGPLPFGPVFDRVLLDAPCSGLGTLRRDLDIRWRREEGDLPAFAAVQRRLLADAAAAVRPGGRLVYATCSSEPEENDEIVSWLLATRTDFVRLDLRHQGHAALGGLVDDLGQLRTLPFRDDLEAYFAAALVRR